MALSLKVFIVEKSVTKTLQFDPSTTIFDACKIIRDKCSELPDLGQPKDYGLFLPGESLGSGAWLEPSKTLDYFLLRNGDMIEYRRKMRPLKVRTLDGTNKTMMIDDSQNVANLMVVICTKMGITNHDEYSLARELPEDNDPLNKSDNYGTLTMRRKREEKERDAKMEQLRKKLKTDDEMNWIDHGKTLREQGVEEAEVLLLRRKFFFSDQNIDQHDPVQLNLLYVQARDAILDGTHPVTQDKACEFAGVQCQIQFGDHNPQKHRAGFLEPKEFLPSSYVKVKTIEKKIFAEHRRHMGLSELDAKALYAKSARALDTYGVTFFLVKEKMPGKNKLVPRLLGVTKDSVLRLDEKTKEILKTWPLTTVRRWAASPNTFTLDFGDYSDQYYSVQTTEGEQIAQLIAGYIDIILKKKQAKDHLGIEGDEGSALFEDNVSPIRATIVQRQPPAVPRPLDTSSVAKPAVIQAGADGMNSIHTGHLQPPHYSTLTGQVHETHISETTMQQLQMAEPMTAHKRALMSGHDAIDKSRDILNQRFDLPPMGDDPHTRKWKETTIDTKKANVQTQIAAMNAATAHVVTLTSTDEVDSGAMGEAVSAISSGLPEVAKDARMLAALMGDGGGDKLIDATRKLCNAFSDLLTAAEPDTKEPRQSLLSAAGRVGDASRALLNTIGEGDETQDMLLALAKAVANTSAALVVKARKCAETVDDPQQREEIISSAAQTALAASELVACAKVVAPTINNEKCRSELMTATRKVAQAVEAVLSSVDKSTKNRPLKDDLQAAAREVSESLNRLMDHIRPQARVSVQESRQEEAVDTILVATDKIITSHDPSDMVRQARILAQATAQLIQAIKGEAEKQPDSDVQKKLIAAAKVLAEATSRLVEAAKACASMPNDPKNQELLKKTAQALREATNDAAGGAVQRKNLRRLETAAKNAASAAAQTIAAAQSASPHCNNATTRDAMSSDCRAVADTIPQLVSAVKSSLQSGDESSQSNLIDATDKFVRPSNSLVSTTKHAVTFIEDSSSQRHLTQCSTKLAMELVELRTSLDRIKADSGLLGPSEPRRQLESAAEKVQEVKAELLACQKAASRNELRPLPGDTMQNSIQRLTSSIRKVGNSTDQLVNSVSASDANGSSQSAQSMSSGLTDLVSASRGVAAASNDSRILIATEEVLERSWTLLRESCGLINSDDSAYEKQAQMKPLAKGVHDALDRVSGSIPGQREVDDAIMTINNASLILDDGVSHLRGIPGSRNYGQLQTELQRLAAEVGNSALDVVGATKNPAKLGTESRHFGGKTTELINAGSQLAALHEDIQIRDEIIITLKSVSITTSNLLVQAKAASVNPDAPGMRNQLSSAARAVNESLNQLIDACSSAAPGQKECDNAVRKIQALRPLLDNPSEPINRSSYFDCQQIVVDQSKLLGDSMTGIANFAKESQLDQFGGSVNAAADAICGLIESTAQSAYLLAASEPTSVAGRPGMVDMHTINQSSQSIKSACQSLSSPKVTQQQVLTSATTIAKHTSALCTSCRVASERTNDSTTKRQFVQMAKDVANATAGLVKEIKALDTDQSSEKKETCKRATDSLIRSVDTLRSYAGQPEFAGVPAKISVKGRVIQEPIVSSGRSVIEGSCNMLTAAKSLAINPKDPPTWHQLAQHSKQVSDSIKRLVTALREKAPGQKECEIAIQKLNNALREVNQASLAAVSQNLPQRKDNTLQGFVQNAEGLLRGAEEHVEPLRISGRSEAENLGHQVSSLTSIIDNLIGNIVGTASNIIETKEQVNLLERTRTVLESCVQYICAAKESGGNSKAINLHPELDLSSQCFQEGLDDLKSSLERISSGAGGLLASITESIAASMVKLDQQAAPSSATESFVDYQSRMVNSAKEIARLSQDMVTKATIDPSKLPQLSQDLSHHYTQLANDARGAITTTISQDVGVRLRIGVQELGRACIDLVRCGNTAQFSHGDTFAQRDLSDANRVVSEKVSDILAALQAGSRGTQACINAASTVSGIIGDLDTTIMFATAGTLHAEGEETFADHRENILKTAKALVEDTKTLVAGAASTQEQLASAAQNAVATIVQLAEAVKFGAASLGSNNPEAQVMLINAVRDVAGALYDLIHSTKSAAGKGTNDPSMLASKTPAYGPMENLKESAKIMVTNVTSLLKTVKAVEDEHTRGTRALEATIEAIAQEVRAFDSPDIPKGRTIAPASSSSSTKKAKYSWEMIVQEPPKTDDVPPQYKDRTIVAREVRKEWSAIGEILNTIKREQRVYHSDGGVEKIRKQIYALVRPEVKEEEFDSPDFDICTPEGYTKKVVGSALSKEEKDEAIRKIKAAKGGVKVDGTNFHLVWRKIGGYERLVLDDETDDRAGGRVVCMFYDCFKYHGTSGVAPFCDAHRIKREFVISDYEDKGSRMQTFFHVLTQFTYESVEKKAERATASLNTSASSGGTTPWSSYIKEFTDAKLPPPTCTEISSRRRYFSTENEANKVYASRQEDLIRVTKPVTQATAKAVAAGSSCRQDDVIVAANMGRKAISDLLTTTKAGAYGVEGEMRERLLIAGRQLAINYRELLQFVLHAINHPGADVKSQLTNCSREIAQAVTELVAVAQLMKVVRNQLSSNPLLGHTIRSSTRVTAEGSEYEDPDDPTVIAENELLGAANSIDAAAKKLEKLRPRRSIKEADESLNFDEMILEAAKSIAAATSALVKAASAAQRELVDTGRVSRKAASDSDDGQWSEGLVSAAQLVAAATHSLVEAANSLVQGHATEEKLISAAKQVASSTAQLLVACKVKSAPDSDATRRLNAAGHAVKRATENLVKAGQQALAQEEERQLVLNKKMVGGIAQEIDARSEVLKIERQLQEARSKLAAIRRAKYHEKTGGMSGYTDESDVDFEGPENSRLDSLLESSAERIQSATTSFNLMRQQQQPQSSFGSYPTTSTPLKPAISPKPGTIDRDRKFNNSSPSYSTISESSIGGGYQSFQQQQQTPPPPPRNFQQAVSIHPPSTFKPQNGTSQQQSTFTTSLNQPPTEDLYARPRHPDQYYSVSTPPPTTPKSTFMKKPSEFYADAQQPKPLIAPTPFVPPKGGTQVMPATFGKTFGKESSGDFSEEFSHYDSGPLQSEQVFETRGADGSVSLQRIFKQEQSSSSSSRVTSSRRVFQQQQENNSST